MKNNFSLSISLFLTLISITLFLGVYFFGYTDEYYQTSLIFNAFVLPILFAVAGIFAIFNLKKSKEVSFSDGFSISFRTMFISGTAFAIFIYIFFNYIDSEAARTFYVQYLDTNLKGLNEEYAPYIKNNDKEKIKIYQAFKEKLISEEERNRNLFTLKNTFYFLGFLYVAYMFLSAILSLFLRNKSIR